MALLASCGGNNTNSAASATASTDANAPSSQEIVIGAIPDQDPQLLQRRYQLLCDYLSAELKVPVRFQPVTDYTAAVLAFSQGDLDMVWFGALTGVQARLHVEGAQAIIQREIDQQFHNVFIAHSSANIQPFTELAGLTALKGKTFTFGSEASTSGRLMPQHFLNQASVTLDDFSGQPGFSGSHDKTIDLVAAGSFAAGSVNEQVWLRRVKAKTVDTASVSVIYRTPPYHNYHWVLHPDAQQSVGADAVAKIQQAFTQLSPEKHSEILALFSANKFIPTTNEAYAGIEKVGREIGIIK